MVDKISGCTYFDKSGDTKEAEVNTEERPLPPLIKDEDSDVDPIIGTWMLYEVDLTEWAIDWQIKRKQPKT